MKPCPYRKEHEFENGLCRHCYAPQEENVMKRVFRECTIQLVSPPIPLWKAAKESLKSFDEGCVNAFSRIFGDGTE